MTKIKLKASPYDPRRLTRTLFNAPFNPAVNFAIEDPLLLLSDPLVQKEGLSYAKYFCSNSPLSSKASEFLKKKIDVEALFSKKAHVEKSILIPYQEDAAHLIERSFLSSQKFFVPDSVISPFSNDATIYFSHKNPASLLSLLQTRKFDHIPVVYMPKLCPIYGRIDFALFEKMKSQCEFFFLVEDHYTFGLEGMTGFGKMGDSKLIDLLITHIPKTFGKLLTLISGSGELLDTLLYYSFTKNALFPPAAYLGMFHAAIEMIESLVDRREKLRCYSSNLLHAFKDQIKSHGPFVTIYLDSIDEKLIFTKALVDKGFLLPSPSFNQNQRSLTFHINYLLEETSIHHLVEIKHSYVKQIICESI